MIWNFPNRPWYLLLTYVILPASISGLIWESRTSKTLHQRQMRNINKLLLAFNGFYLFSVCRLLYDISTLVSVTNKCLHSVHDSQEKFHLHLEWKRNIQLKIMACDVHTNMADTIRLINPNSQPTKCWNQATSFISI
jgi:hypothetical protein